ncbi:MAG: Fic/DOC N-terminal [Firmicutes bacterium]|nr:Fic/DOC N-terminal [Bacillota bacterium]
MGKVYSYNGVIKAALPRVHSKELVALLFYEFYIKTIYIENGLGISRKAVANYAGFLASKKLGKERIYLNKRF